ncbi:MAG: bifunctional glutamate N-acetyltransferase/amino-acid acetyltransferase ArgJ [Leptospiraceae bacterium]|nr:bifunctional glutamate N-acetyltransferase/amino-acid acetyltransferase ArgJ [Leptospiraceae bacterium]MDW8305891.1 bifunctional glutamate N-acetyltransferase/amino-acid acetyltransferase ArgJ [Leptospiraceae bacterium]
MEKPQKIRVVPRGFYSYVTSAGIKDTSLDLGVIYSEVEAQAAAVFTQNKVCGNPVKVAQRHIRQGKIQALIVNSKNSNVATGREGYEAALQLCQKVGEELSINPQRVFPASTGVIGRRFPIEKIVTAISGLKEKLVTPPDFVSFAKAIMTTDTYPKFGERSLGKAHLVGVAKGSGMIAPNMATMLAFFFTDAQLSSNQLRKILKETVKKTFNCLSIDSDTSTSDTVLVLANGLGGPVSEDEFRKNFLSLAEELTMHLARDGEGATKLFLVDVLEAKNDQEAHKIGLSIINSPLVKTAIYKGDPNWGRIFMAIGKTPGVRVVEEKIQLFWGPEKIASENLTALHKYLVENEVVHLEVRLGLGQGKARVYGCDLTEEYVRINAYYTT